MKPNLPKAALRAVTALAAILGITIKAGASGSQPAAAQKDAPQEPAQSGARTQPTEPAAGSMHALLQGSWTPPPQLGVRHPAQAGLPADAEKKPKFDDLGFISHIDSGFNDFNDRFGGR